MKRILVFIVVMVTFLGCKNDAKKESETMVEESEVSNEIGTVTGSFMYYADAAVFQTKSELFGVVQNEMLQDLIIQSEILKTEPTDEVNVTLKVKKSKKPENEEGWDNRIEILEIVKVSKANPNDNKIIKLGKKSESL